MTSSVERAREVAAFAQMMNQKAVDITAFIHKKWGKDESVIAEISGAIAELKEQANRNVVIGNLYCLLLGGVNDDGRPYDGYNQITAPQLIRILQLAKEHKFYKMRDLYKSEFLYNDNNVPGQRPTTII